jgi:nitrogen fixation protein
MGKPVEIYAARDLLHAYMLKAALEEEGIHVEIDNEHLQTAAGELPLGWSTAPRILVDESDAPRAVEILEALEASREDADKDGED